MVTVILSLTIGILCTLIIPVSWPKSIWVRQIDTVWYVCQPTRCFLWKAQKLHEACPAIGISCSPGWHLCDLGRCFDRNLTDLTCSLNAPEGPKNRPKHHEAEVHQRLPMGHLGRRHNLRIAARHHLAGGDDQTSLPSNQAKQSPVDDGSMHGVKESLRKIIVLQLVW